MAKKFGKSGSAAMYAFAAILFGLAAIVDQNMIYAAIGVCFLFLGFAANKRKHK